MLIRLGSRGSRLALTQAELVADALRSAVPEADVAIVPITTAGDRDRSKPFGEIGARGVFVKELEEALLAGRIDVAVHSAKDMTSTDAEGLAVGAYLPREDPRDALCGADGLRPGMRIGTASVRRRAQLLALEPSLSVEPLRGNVDTRLRKRGERGLDAIVLAAAGLERLGLGAEIGKRFEPEEVLPEAGQGALALQLRAGDEGLVATLDDAETRRRVQAERACVARIGGGCLAPVAAYHDGVLLTALVADEDGAWIERRSGADPARARRRAARRHGLLAFMKVVLTGTERLSAPLAADLEALGLEVETCPLVAVEPLDGEPVRADGYDWLLLTSRNGVEALFPRLQGSLPRVAVVGRGTAEALREHGVEPDLVAAVSTQEGLAAELPRPAGRVLFAGAEDARDVLVRELGADFVPLYRTVELRPERLPEADLAVLASASAARTLAALGSWLPCVSIGPVTTAAARARGLRVLAEAVTHDRKGLVEAVKLAAFPPSSPS